MRQSGPDDDTGLNGTSFPYALLGEWRKEETYYANLSLIFTPAQADGPRRLKPIQWSQEIGHYAQQGGEGRYLRATCTYDDEDINRTDVARMNSPVEQQPLARSERTIPRVLHEATTSA